jgi:CubicO group peptidase (beta-lactamase class C family)
MKGQTLFHILVMALAILTGCKKQEAPTTSLPRSTPETEGVSSEGILRFLQSIDTSRHEFHSFMMLRHGKVIAEGWWNPYRADLKHTMYSVSKSWTSTAAGFAVSEGLLSVDDPVISFFPHQLPENVSENLKALRVKDLLSMSAGQEPDPSWKVTRETDWIKAFFETPLVRQPGTEFLYNTLATYMVSAILQQVTGQRVIDYLKPRLFDPLGIEGMDWETDPNGISVGGWGLRVKTEDMAKLGQLYLQQGVWNGKQLLPKDWIEEATSAVMEDSAPYLPDSLKAKSDWAQGYGYQFWRCRFGAYRADGAYGQYIIVIPELDVVIAITSETPDMQGVLNLVWSFLLPAVSQNTSLPDNQSANAQLSEKLASLALPVPKAPGSIPVLPDSERLISFDANDLKITALQLRKGGSDFLLSLTANDAKYDFLFGAGTWRFGETTKPGPYLIPAKNYFAGLPPHRVAGAYTGNENQLEFTLRYIESPHSERMVIDFMPENSVSFTVYPSNLFGQSSLSITGR